MRIGGLRCGPLIRLHANDSFDQHFTPGERPHTAGAPTRQFETASFDPGSSAWWFAPIDEVRTQRFPSDVQLETSFLVRESLPLPRLLLELLWSDEAAPAHRMREEIGHRRQLEGRPRADRDFEPIVVRAWLRCLGWPARGSERRAAESRPNLFSEHHLQSDKGASVSQYRSQRCSCSSSGGEEEPKRGQRGHGQRGGRPGREPSAHAGGPHRPSKVRG
mmetsp:Transcript_5619/g.13202  ORF Transcript_5619/g.13202 Transcript_5619/m.13202 type:complete len:219 (-) Transcript_5619:237-893(-)